MSVFVRQKKRIKFLRFLSPSLSVSFLGGFLSFQHSAEFSTSMQLTTTDCLILGLLGDFWIFIRAMFYFNSVNFFFVVLISFTCRTNQFLSETLCVIVSYRNKKLSCRRQTARASCHWIFCCHSRSLKVIRSVTVLGRVSHVGAEPGTEVYSARAILSWVGAMSTQWQLGE